MKFLKQVLKVEEKAVWVLFHAHGDGRLVRRFGPLLSGRYPMKGNDKKLLAGFLLVPAIYIVGTAIALAVFG